MLPKDSLYTEARSKTGSSGPEEKTLEDIVEIGNGFWRAPAMNEFSNNTNAIAQLEQELENLKLKLSLYEEPPDFDLNEYHITVDGIQKTKPNMLGVGSHVRYCISVENPKINKCLKVFRRFNDWVSLSDILERELASVLLPRRPPKKLAILGGNLDSEFIEIRILQLQAYTQCLVRHPKVRNNKYFRKFLYLPTEQWEELIGSVTAIGSSFSNRDKTFERLGEPEFKQKIWKGFEETGKSILGSFGLKLHSTSKSDSTGISRAEKFKEFYDLYDSFTSVEVKDPKDQEGPASKQTGKLKQITRFDITQKAADSIFDHTRVLKKESNELDKLAESLEKLSMGEGTQMGPEFFGLLNGLSQVLHQVASQNEAHIFRMGHRNSDKEVAHQVLQVLQQSTYIAQGATDLYDKICEASSASGEFPIHEAITDLNFARQEDREKLCRALLPFAEQQIERVTANRNAFTRLYDALSSMDFE